MLPAHVLDSDVKSNTFVRVYAKEYCTQAHQAVLLTQEDALVGNVVQTPGPL